MGPEEHRETEKKEPGEGQGPRFSQPLSPWEVVGWGGGAIDPELISGASSLSLSSLFKGLPCTKPFPFLVFIHTDSHQTWEVTVILISQLGWAQSS